MRQKILYILVFMLINVGFLHAQCCGEEQKMIQQITGDQFKIYYNQFEGSPFYTNDWLLANIKVNSGEVYTNKKVKFDIYKDDIIYYNEILKRLIIIDDEIIEEVQLLDENGSYVSTIVSFCSDTIGSCKYYIMHYSDSISLLSRYQKKIENYNDASRSSHYLGNYYQVGKNYMVINDEFIHIPKNKRILAQMYPSNKREIIAFINKNKLRLKNLNDLKQIVVEINRLEKDRKSVYLPKKALFFWR